MSIATSVAPEVGLADQLFGAFTEGYPKYQAHDELAEQIELRETGLVSAIRNGALGGIDQLETPLLTASDYPKFASEALELLANKAKLERLDLQLKSEASRIGGIFLGKEVRVEAINPAENRPITRFYYSGGLAGSRRYEPAGLYRQKARGTITQIDRRNGLLWVTSRVGTGRIGRFIGDPPYKWQVEMPTQADEEPLVRVDFV